MVILLDLASLVLLVPPLLGGLSMAVREHRRPEAIHIPRELLYED